MKAPACDPGDCCISLRAESTLLIPEIAKSADTPKRFQHVSPFAFFEVGFIGWIVRVRFAFDLDVPFDGSALGVVQPDFSWPSFVIAGFTEEGPVTIPASVKVFRFEPARAFVRVPSSCPLPQTREDVAIHVSKRAFAHHVPMIVRPTANLRVELIVRWDARSDQFPPCQTIIPTAFRSQSGLPTNQGDIANFIKTFTGDSGPIPSATRGIRWARAHWIVDRRSGVPGGAWNILALQSRRGELAIGTTPEAGRA